MTDDPRIAEAKAFDWDSLIDRLGLVGLKRLGRERTGPCPGCGGNDRFSINTAKGVINCRKCGAAGDQIALVQLALGRSFPEALEWLCGPKQDLTPEERAARAEAERKRQADMQARQDRYRAKAIAAAREVWQAGRPPEGTAVRDYLTRRGIPRDLFPRLPYCLRFHPALPLMVQVDGAYREVYRGPAMLAAVRGPDGRFSGCHRTWLDLSQPKGKAIVADPLHPGDTLPAKKLIGTKKGGAIRFTGGLQAETMVMGEGIETTLSALVADRYPGAVYWCGVDLGNISGQRMIGKGRKFAGIPDMTDDEAFVPPPWVRRLILIQDGDSDPPLTRAKLLSGARRAMLKRPGLRAQIVHAGEGRDLNDVLMVTP